MWICSPYIGFSLLTVGSSFETSLVNVGDDIFQRGGACNPLVLFFICYLVSSIFKVMLAESSLFNLKAIQVLDCILPLKFF